MHKSFWEISMYRHSVIINCAVTERSSSSMSSGNGGGTYHFPDHKLDLIRRFALSVEIHFRQQHEVKFYAEALHKSPKTLSNLFALYKQPTPSEIIHNRIILEAKRLFLYTDKSAKEAAFELGFANPEHFSRFFKSKTGFSIPDFKKQGPKKPATL